jgi:hypothetical protein
MKNLIRHGPLDPPTIGGAPNPSDLESILNGHTAEPIDGHPVILRETMKTVEGENGGGKSGNKFGGY